MWGWLRRNLPNARLIPVTSTAEAVRESAEGEGIGWLQRIIGYCARKPLITLVAVLALTFGGWQALQRAPLDAIPDLSDVQVIVFTDWPGRSPDLVEDQIT